MGKKFVIMFIAVLLLLSSFTLVSAQGSWKGIVKISNATGNNLTAQDGTVVEAYVNGVLKKRTTVRNDSHPSVPQGYYIITVVGVNDDNVTFKVWNLSINGINSSAQPWGFGPHPSDSFGDYFNLTISTLAAGSTCTWSNACTGDYCCNGGTECNGRCTGTCQASACAAATSSSPTSGGGGSGTSAGGGGTTTTTEETASVPSVSPSSSSSFTFAKSSDLSVSEIVLTATETVTNNPSITVKTTTFSGAAPVSSSLGSVYKYLLITKLNINDNQIGKATVKFKVEKKWLKDNKIDSKTVKLNRLVNGVWQELATKKLGEDSANAEYEAETPGFSTFAISGLKQAKPITAFGIIDEIRAYYAGSSVYSAFELIDIIRAFYAGG